ncbi:MAG: carbohydrate ABC transporter permease [Candidatus Merdivicinus sp.]|jgi:putative aldouronate transport system permease protein
MKPTKGEKVFNVINILILLLFALICLFPFVHVFAKSISSEASIVAGEVVLWPKDLQLEAYKAVFGNKSMNNSFFFTVYTTVLGTAVNILLTVLAAYPLSKGDLIGKKPLWLMILFTMFFSGGMIPLYLVVNGLHLINTVWALILPGAISTYNMIIMKTFFQNIPDSLEESAMLDGCTEIGVLFRIVLPLSLPVIATLSLFYAVGHWNNFMSSLLYINDTSKFTLQLKLRQLVLQDDVSSMMEGANAATLPRESLKAASIMYATLPILIVYPWLQKYFVKGVLVGSVKA